MGDEMPRIRRATSDEVCEDAFLGDMQVQVTIEAPPRSALRRGIEQWGEPAATYGPGDWLWRLRCGDLPLRVSICPRGSAWALFNLYARPDEEDEERILAELSEMLSDDDSR